MAAGLLGRKVGMTQIFDSTGKVIPVTVIHAGPCHVLQVKTVAQDKYEAIQVGYLDKPRRLAIRSSRGHVARLESKRQKSRQAAGVQPVAKADCEPKRFVREFRTTTDGYQVGQETQGRPVRQRQGGQRHRHHQGPRHHRRHEAAQLRRPAPVTA